MNGRIATGESKQIHEPYASCRLDDAKKQIRVLDIALAERPGDTTEEIFSRLRVVDLDSKPLFEALSYVWGRRPDGSSTIVCNNKRINVTRNCFSALQALRAKLGSFSI